jgi:hypothetical protein
VWHGRSQTSVVTTTAFDCCREGVIQPRPFGANFYHSGDVSPRFFCCTVIPFGPPFLLSQRPTKKLTLFLNKSFSFVDGLAVAPAINHSILSPRCFCQISSHIGPISTIPSPFSRGGSDEAHCGVGTAAAARLCRVLILVRFEL